METKERVKGRRRIYINVIMIIISLCVCVCLVHRHVRSNNLLSLIIGDSVVCEGISHGNHVVDDWILIHSFNQSSYTPNTAKMFYFFSTSSK